MFRFLKRLGGDCVAPVLELPAKAAEAHKRGYAVNLETGLCTVATSADAAIVGVANENLTPAVDGEKLEVILALDDVVFEVDYVGTTKTSLTNADIGTAFDMVAGGDKINLDDTLDGMWVVIGFDNAAKKAHVVLSGAKRAPILP